MGECGKYLKTGADLPHANDEIRQKVIEAPGKESCAGLNFIEPLKPVPNESPCMDATELVAEGSFVLFYRAMT